MFPTADHQTHELIRHERASRNLENRNLKKTTKQTTITVQHKDTHTHTNANTPTHQHQHTHTHTHTPTHTPTHRITHQRSLSLANLFSDGEVLRYLRPRQLAKANFEQHHSITAIHAKSVSKSFYTQGLLDRILFPFFSPTCKHHMLCRIAACPKLRARSTATSRLLWSSFAPSLRGDFFL